jgi:hypothetical protein
MEGNVVVVVTLCNSCLEMALRHDMMDRMRAAEDAAAAAATAGGGSVILGGMTPAFFAIFSVFFFVFLRWIH